MDSTTTTSVRCPRKSERRRATRAWDRDRRKTAEEGIEGAVGLPVRVHARNCGVDVLSVVVVGWYLAVVGQDMGGGEGQGSAAVVTLVSVADVWSHSSFGLSVLTARPGYPLPPPPNGGRMRKAHFACGSVWSLKARELANDGSDWGEVIAFRGNF